MGILCNASSANAVECNQHRFSIHERGFREAETFKWIESEKAGRDLGAEAIRCWIRQHWNGFLRARWLEHLEGRTYWIELERSDFGLLTRIYPGSPLFQVIFEKLRAGQENLDVIKWALDISAPIDDVIEILVTFDVNSRRIECKLESNLCGLG